MNHGRPLTDAVVSAVVLAGSLVNRFPEWLRDERIGQALDVQGTFRCELEGINRELIASNDLLKRAAEFRKHYETIPDPIGDVSEPSYHELGRALASTFPQCAWFSSHLPPRAWLVPLAQHFEPSPRQLRAVQEYLCNDAPKFDAGRLVAQIQDEAGRAAQRKIGDELTVPEPSLQECLANELPPQAEAGHVPLTIQREQGLAVSPSRCVSPRPNR